MRPGRPGLIFNEPLLWEMGARGRMGLSLPRRDVPEHPLDPALAGRRPRFSGPERAGDGAPLHPPEPVELRGGHQACTPWAPAP
jgi:hypothetical protein